MDSLSHEKRSWLMSRIKSTDTIPEVIVRSFLHQNGFRFRLHVKNLPGKPDIVFPKYKTIVDIRGCFWHSHKNCDKSRIPSTNSNWWENKLRDNILRDAKHVDDWESEGWKILVVWSCLFKHIKKNNKAEILDYLMRSFNAIIHGQHQYLEISWNDFCDRRNVFHG